MFIFQNLNVFLHILKEPQEVTFVILRQQKRNLAMNPLFVFTVAIIWNLEFKF